EVELWILWRRYPFQKNVAYSGLPPIIGNPAIAIDMPRKWLTPQQQRVLLPDAKRLSDRSCLCSGTAWSLHADERCWINGSCTADYMRARPQQGPRLAEAKKNPGEDHPGCTQNNAVLELAGELHAGPTFFGRVVAIPRLVGRAVAERRVVIEQVFHDQVDIELVVQRAEANRPVPQ